MLRKDRQITDPALLSAMLDMCPILHIAVKNEPFPYVVPVNYGYEWEGGALVFYFHSAREGMKLELLRADPRVTVNAAAFISYAEAPYRGHLHDYRSVTASGTAEEIPFSDKERFLRAHELLLEHNHRTMQPEDLPVLEHISLWEIRCAAENVWGKAEIVPSRPEEVPFAAN